MTHATDQVQTDINQQPFSPSRESALMSVAELATRQLGQTYLAQLHDAKQQGHEDGRALSDAYFAAHDQLLRDLPQEYAYCGHRFSREEAIVAGHLLSVITAKQRGGAK